MEPFAEQLPAWLETIRFPVFGRLLLALALGAVIGLERELAGKPAGLRTNMLICVGAALFTETSVLIASNFATHELVRADPGRVTAGIVSGIGFIGAGTILFARGSVLGLTTAATIWVVAAIGVAVGVHAYIEAIGATFLVIVVLLIIGFLEEHFFKARAERRLRVSLAAPHNQPEPVEALFRELGLRSEPLSLKREAGWAEYAYAVHGPRKAWRDLIPKLSALDGVRSVSIE